MQQTERNGAPAAGDLEAVDEDATIVLVVEDNADMRAYIRAHLEDTYHIEEAEDGVVGLERAKALVPDLVLSDVMMPELDGFGLLAALRADARTSHIPVVLLTAKADAESKIVGLETGADDYLAKPFNAEVLRARVRNLIEQRRRLRATYSREVLMRSPDELGLPSAEVVFLTRVKADIEARLDQTWFGVDALASEVGMSPRQLRRKLEGLLGERPNELIRRMRLQRAAVLLREKVGLVKEVAYAVGFKSESHFHKAFREVYGVTPSAYAREQ